MREKVKRHVSGREVAYDEDRWHLLRTLRERARRVQRALPTGSVVYGSVARGDVHSGSDIDVVLEGLIPSFEVELAMDGEFHVLDRRITIASPGAVPKASLELAEGASVGWPLLAPKEREAEFHRFGGALDVASAPPLERVPGVTKSLLLIEPTPVGHRESSVVGVEVDVARTLGLQLDVILERVRVLSRRDAVGRTGVFRSVAVPEGETFEQVLMALADSTPAIRRQLRYRGSR